MIPIFYELELSLYYFYAKVAIAFNYDMSNLESCNVGLITFLLDLLRLLMAGLYVYLEPKKNAFAIYTV